MSPSAEVKDFHYLLTESLFDIFHAVQKQKKKNSIAQLPKKKHITAKAQTLVPLIKVCLKVLLRWLKRASVVFRHVS